MKAKRILLVDDDEDLLRGLNFRLRANGYETILAKDGYSAINMAQKEKPDLIILDIGLPAGDGFIVMERLGKVPSLTLIPVIVLTARDSQTNKTRALKAGAVAFFQKPADNDQLLAVIQKVFRRFEKQMEERT
ncbi:MAG: response regulator [Desulfobacterales bacterium]|nr:response regulator [Desulfobacterales bacterium]